MEKFLRRPKLLGLIEEEIENMDIPITNEEIKSVIKKFSTPRVNSHVIYGFGALMKC